MHGPPRLHGFIRSRLEFEPLLPIYRSLSVSGILTYASVGVRTVRLAQTLIAVCRSLKIRSMVVCELRHVYAADLRVCGGVHPSFTLLR
jgi:hypothetical protein